MSENFAAFLYLVSGVLFILALRGLSHPTTSRQGNMFGMIGMGIAVLTTVGLIFKLGSELATAGIEVVDAATQAAAADALLALGAQWALVKGGHLRDSPESPDLLTDGTESVEFTAPLLTVNRSRQEWDDLENAIQAAVNGGR